MSFDRRRKMISFKDKEIRIFYEYSVTLKQFSKNVRNYLL